MIVTAYTREFRNIAKYTVPLMEMYCKEHGITFLSANISKTYNRPPSWRKLPLFLELLQRNENLLWIDADISLVVRHTNIFTQIPNDCIQALVVHNTNCGTVPNCGLWYMTKEIIPWLEKAWELEQYLHHAWWEQAAMLELMGYDGINKYKVALKEPTELHKRTHWLGNEWNHHPLAINNSEKTYWYHVTQYENRVKAVKEFHHASVVAKGR